jgi:hypothetical protein
VSLPLVYEEVVLQSIPKSALGLCWLCALTLLAVFATPVAATGWRSELYPADWTPGFADAEGRFLQDFSFAGYHAGTREIPEGAVAPVVDVTQPPYSADFSGQTDATQAVQAAIDTVGGAGGGTVYLPPGTYKAKRSIYTSFCSRDPLQQRAPTGGRVRADVPAPGLPADAE